MRLAPVLLLWTTLSSACTPTPDAEAQALLRLHQLHRSAHFEGEAEAFVSTFADTLLSVQHGEVFRSSRAENVERFQPYVDRSTFLAWDDIAPPVIRVSADGTIAYAVVRKRVRLTTPDSIGVPQEEETEFAWLETWEKMDGAWRLTAIASTERPASDPAP